MKPPNETELAGDDAAKMQKILDALETLDDVQESTPHARVAGVSFHCASSASIPVCGLPALA